MMRYILKKEDDIYFIMDGEQNALTPGGNPIRTTYEPLAERLVKDLNEYGIEWRQSDSIVPWHFTMIDNFAGAEHNELVKVMCDSFFGENEDWTYYEGQSTSLFYYVGGPRSRKRNIENWLNKCTHMQLVAACCIGNAYESLNIAYIMAFIIERNHPEQWDAVFEKFAMDFERGTLYGDYDSIKIDFENFKLYYGIHFNEKGPALPAEAETLESDQDCSMDALFTDIDISEELLIGNNFVHYIDGDIVSSVEKIVSASGINVSLNEDESDDEDDSDDENELLDLIPNDCWVKRFVDDENASTYYNLYLEVEDGGIIDAGCIEETDMSAYKSYDDCYYPPHTVAYYEEYLLSNRFLSEERTLIGKRLPQSIIDKGGNDGSKTNYTYAIQSAYRLAYNHMSIETTEEGIIKSFEYSSYQSSGDGHRDMFSRPVLIDDNENEVMDSLLYIMQEYTDEEWEALF